MTIPQGKEDDVIYTIYSETSLQKLITALTDLYESIKKDDSGEISMSWLKLIETPTPLLFNSPNTHAYEGKDLQFYTIEGSVKREMLKQLQMLEDEKFELEYEIAKFSYEKINALKDQNPKAFWLNSRKILLEKNGDWRDGPEYSEEEYLKAYEAIKQAGVLGCKEARYDYLNWAVDDKFKELEFVLVNGWIEEIIKDKLFDLSYELCNDIMQKINEGLKENIFSNTEKIKDVFSYLKSIQKST